MTEAIPTSDPMSLNTHLKLIESLAKTAAERHPDSWLILEGKRIVDEYVKVVRARENIIEEPQFHEIGIIDTGVREPLPNLPLMAGMEDVMQPEELRRQFDALRNEPMNPPVVEHHGDPNNNDELAVRVVSPGSPRPSLPDSPVSEDFSFELDLGSEVILLE